MIFKVDLSKQKMKKVFTVEDGALYILEPLAAVGIAEGSCASEHRFE